jgi:hypothetical protein
MRESTFFIFGCWIYIHIAFEEEAMKITNEGKARIRGGGADR